MGKKHRSHNRDHNHNHTNAHNNNNCSHKTNGASDAGQPVPKQLPLLVPAERLTKAKKKEAQRVAELVEQKDVAEVRRLATEAGAWSDECRRKAWPLLAGVVTEKPVETEDKYSHPEKLQLDLDLDRSFQMIKEDGHRKVYRDAMRRMLLAALTKFGAITDDMKAETRWYYQGLHDIASVLLVICGEQTGAAILERLLVWHLSPWMERGAAQMREVLTLVYPIIQEADPELAGALGETLVAEGMNSDYALPWLLTWMTHSYIDKPDVCARLVDFSLASPPIIIVYLCAAATLSRKEEVLKYDEATMHYSLLSKLEGDPPIEEWIQTALALHKRLPPEKLVRRVHGRSPPPVLDPYTSPLFAYPSDPSLVQEEIASRIRSRKRNRVLLPLLGCTVAATLLYCCRKLPPLSDPLAFLYDAAEGYRLQVA